MGTDVTSFESGPAPSPMRSNGPAAGALNHPCGANAWTELLTNAIESEILPRLRADHSADHDKAAEASGLTSQDVATFLDHVIADEMDEVRAIADRVIVQEGGRDALLNGLLTPAARRLGEMWEHDVCDFMTVTLGVYRLDQIMKETASVCRIQPFGLGFDHRILILPVPGEQHLFGAAMVADAFREAGWCVRSGPAVSRSKLLHLVREEWFDVIGLSVASERWLKGLPACIRAVRQASCNQKAGVMIGGHAIIHHPERSRFLGADITARDANEAVLRGNNFVGSTVTQRLQPFRGQAS